MEHRTGSDDRTTTDSASREIRSRAVDRIGRTPATLLRAPAGFGKSTAMRIHRSTTDGRRSAWVSFAAVPPSDAAPIAALLIDAVGSLAATPDATAHLRPIAPLVGRRIGQPFVRALGDALLELDGAWRLYLDDLHRLPETVAEELGDLVVHVAVEAEQRTSGALIMATRNSPPWPVDRWQRAGWLTVIGIDELRLDEPETRDVLGERHGEHAPEVLATTSGWPAAVAAAGSRLESSRVGGGPVEARAAVEAVDAYIRDEVLADLDPADLSLLLRLAEAAGAASPAVLSRDAGGARRRLRRLAEETALVIEHADEQFELHPLLARAMAEHLGRHGR